MRARSLLVSSLALLVALAHGAQTRSRLSVIVLDENNKVLHSQLVPEIASEPNYDAALAVLK